MNQIPKITLIMKKQFLKYDNKVQMKIFSEQSKKGKIKENNQRENEKIIIKQRLIN